MKNKQKQFSVLGDMNADIFLKKFWQKKPLFIKGALKDFSAPFTKKDLQRFAKSSNLESRMISSDQSKKNWQVHYGPFRSKDLKLHSEGKTTLLVQGVEKLAAPLNTLLFSIQFLPRWRLADIMVSDGGAQSSVGPHYDSYDVFLVQLKGEKLWKIGKQQQTRPKLLNNCDLKILAQPKELCTQEYLASPGDVLYLPPMVPHYGIGQNDNQTYSIGFLAPSHQEIMSDYFASLSEQIDSDLRFKDPLRHKVINPSELDEASIEQFIRIMKSYTPKPDQIKDWLGRYLTQNYPANLPDTIANTKNISAFEAAQNFHLNSLSLAPGIRAYYANKTTAICLYIAGEVYSYKKTKSNVVAIKTLCEQDCFNSKQLFKNGVTSDFIKDFKNWRKEGLILPADGVIA